MKSNLYRLGNLEELLCSYQGRGFKEAYRWMPSQWENMWEAIIEAYRVNVQENDLAPQNSASSKVSFEMIN